MSLLTIVQNASARLGLTRPSTVTTSSDPLAVTLLGLAQEEGKTLARRHSWQVMQSEYTFSTVASTASYALPTGFDRILVDTVFNRTSRRRMMGDLTPAQWQETQASLVTMVNPAFRIRGNLFYISPTPSAVETVAYEYISKNWCQSAGGTGQEAWNLDTDTGILDEELMTLGIVWRFRAAKGLDYAESMNSYELQVANAILRDGAPVRIDTSNCERDRVPNAPVVPETLPIS
jgi:hypothetical protein